MDKDWFEMREFRKRRFADAVWIPLRVSEHIDKHGKYGYVGYKDEFFGLGSVAIPTERREDAKKLSWSEIGSHNQGVWASKGYYKRVDVYQYDDKNDLGVELVLAQIFDADEPAEWNLNQDVIFALGLLREGDQWVRPSEDYCAVAKLRRDDEGRPIAMEIKNEFLRDYLCARNLFLRMALYRNRDVIVEDPADAGAPDETKEHSENERFEIRVIPIIEGGFSDDSSYAVFRIGRSDVDPDEDVPRPGPQTDANTVSESWKGKHEGRNLVRVIGELWRNEEIEPATNSTRVRGDSVPSGIRYIVDASGETLSSEELHDESRIQWLWFRPHVVPALMKHRGGHFCWYTQETGGVGCSASNPTHFGLNSIGMVTVLAYDVAKLPVWQQRIWSGYNVAPEGGVASELLSAQMRAIVAETTAPEVLLPDVMRGLDELFGEVIGSPLFRPHSATEKLAASINRFRALDPDGVFALAKDLMRMVADRIDSAALQKVVSPPKGEKWRSLKSLEKYLATTIPAEDARSVMGPLAGAYDLRLADAHLPPAELNVAYELVRVDPKAKPLVQGFQLIVAVTSALIEIGRIMVAKKAREEDV